MIVFTFRIQINSKYEYAQGELQTLHRGLRRGKTPQKHQEGGGKPAKNGGRLKPAAGKKRPRQTAGQNKKCLPSHKYGFPYPPNAKTGILGWNDAKNEFYKFNLCLYT